MMGGYSYGIYNRHIGEVCKIAKECVQKETRRKTYQSFRLLGFKLGTGKENATCHTWGGNFVRGCSGMKPHTRSSG